MMKAINIDQPWAELIIKGRKTIELREKDNSHRGILAIRANKVLHESECRKHGLDPEELNIGVILGTVELAGVIRITPELWRSLRDQHLNDAPNPGRFEFGWRMENPRPLEEPIPCSPLPGMFKLPDGISDRVAEALQTK